MSEAVHQAAETVSRLVQSELPVVAHKQEIENALPTNSVIIIQSPTGSGKTTEVPQMALQLHDGDRPLFDDIVLTQPLIPATRGAAAYIGQQLFSKFGGRYSVGYATSKDSSPGPQYEYDLRVLTDGKAAVQMLFESMRPQSDKKRLLIIDEVHEMNTRIELLLALAAERTDPNSKHYDPNLTVVIMSATMDTKQLKQHFKHANSCTIGIEVPTFKVLESQESGGIGAVALRHAGRMKTGRVLAFVPGAREAREIEKVGSRIPVITLNGRQTRDEQQLAIEESDEVAVVASTNVAETGITIPDVRVVVDGGEVREASQLYTQIKSGSRSLQLKAASQASLTQRRGRVGRKKRPEGQEDRYVLCSPDGALPVIPFAERAEYTAPDMERVALDSLMLQLIATGRSIETMRFLHRPPKKAVQAARQHLRTLNAIDEHDTITTRGMEMASLPLDPEYACMIAFAKEKGYSARVQQNVLDVVAIMQRGGIIKRDPNEQSWRTLLAEDKLGDVKEIESDFIAQLELYVAIASPDMDINWSGIDTYAVGLVEAERANLAKKLDVTLHEIVPVIESDREDVLTCINAGQLNQLWSRASGAETWTLDGLETSGVYMLDESTVVRELGTLATGTLFTLKNRGKTTHKIQDVNITTLTRLENAAEHLLTDNVEVVYDPRQGHKEAIARVTRSLGELVICVFERPVMQADIVDDKTMKMFCRQEFDSWNKQQPKLAAMDTSELVSSLLYGTDTAVYGRNPVTGEPLRAWRGQRIWCDNPVAAQASMMAAIDRLKKAPAEAIRRQQKTEADVLETRLRRAVMEGTLQSAVVKAFTKERKKTPLGDWLERATTMLDKG